MRTVNDSVDEKGDPLFGAAMMITTDVRYVSPLPSNPPQLTVARQSTQGTASDIQQ
jgi:hypothetical protein